MILTGNHWTLHIGDCRQSMATMPAGSVHDVVTSPPYLGLRDYGVADQLGSESTPEEYIANQIEVFRAVRRVLRDDGVCFVNMGDTYSSGTTAARNPSKNHDGNGYGKHGYWTNPNSTMRVNDPSLSAGNQMLMPHRFALAMQVDGWLLRSTIIWSKPSPMPESVNGCRWIRCRVKVDGTGWTPEARPEARGVGDCKTRSAIYGSNNGTIECPYRAQWTDCPGCDKCRSNGGLILRRGSWRPTTGHEYVFLFTKSQRYFCDAEAAKEPTTGNAHSRGNGVNPKSHNGTAGVERQNNGFSAAVNSVVESRNPRTVWTISSEALKAAHFAAFPTALVHKCLLPAISPGGCCAACGAQYAPLVESVRLPTRPGTNTKVPGRNSRIFQERDPNHDGEYKAERFEELTGRASQHADSPYHDHSGSVVGNRDPKRHTTATRVIEYRPTCSCGAPKSRAVVLDPYTGSGTTGRVAIAMGADFIGCELSEKYAREIAEPRLNIPWVPDQVKEGDKARQGATITVPQYLAYGSKL